MPPRALCGKYLTNNPGRVITTDVIACLVAKAWPLSVTPVGMSALSVKSDPLSSPASDPLNKALRHCRH